MSNEELTICYHYLIAEDPSIITSDLVHDKEKFEAQAAAKLQEFIHQIYKTLPYEDIDVGRVGVLAPIHERKFKLPRSLPIPAAQKLPTKWEEFAKKKGIQKRRKQALVFDPVEKNWKINRGGRSLKHAEDKRTWFIEHKDHENPYVDPFKLRREMKSLEKAKQKMKEVSNKVRKAGYKLK
eukprot:Blabericola_migrator_1__9389@NODE_506_length_7963_cov_38_720618_g388_i0_p8_GENE_NODE_506_length_7963_cov_38_720618_g388_i0NODE_506_length_7963_cov_38_720618_g388_i0_p8_ORF_typecomplete_len181_score39_08RRS1/PF04939_12/6_6e33DUF4390/PF14334_6/0_076_NODE_506_length_7963_cov_38_720618_g388_i061806722